MQIKYTFYPLFKNHKTQSHFYIHIFTRVTHPQERGVHHHYSSERPGLDFRGGRVHAILAHAKSTRNASTGGTNGY